MTDVATMNIVVNIDDKASSKLSKINSKFSNEMPSDHT